jgi:hypothetical protein
MIARKEGSGNPDLTALRVNALSRGQTTRPDREPRVAARRSAVRPLGVANTAIGVAFFVFTIPFSYWLAGVFAHAGSASTERQTTQLKRFREKRKNYKRNRDDFLIG